MSKIKRKILLAGIAVLVVISGVAAMSAFEAHIINVTAKIENALSVLPLKIEFGKVFPQEELDEKFEISLSDSFFEQERVNTVEYQIIGKEKPLPDNDGFYPSLCESLTIDDKDLPYERSISKGDLADELIIKLRVPCFEGMCEQGYEGLALNPGLEGEVFGCDLWVEVTDIFPAAAIWHFDEGSGTTAYDSSGNNNHGTINGASWTTGKYDGALSFNGVNDYVSIPHSSSLDIINQITIEAWIKLEDIPNTYSAVVSKGAAHPGSYMMHLDERSPTTYRVCPVFYIGGSYGNWQVGCSNDLNYGEWHHVAVVYDGSFEKTFVNGVLQGQEARTGNIDSTPDSVEIGHDSRYPVGTRHMRGIIDEVRISNVARY